MKQILIIVLVPTFFFSCGRDRQTIVQTETPKEIKKDSTFIEIADLPIEIDSVDYLIHPIGDYNITDESGKLILKSSRYDRSNSFSISHFNGYSISGNISNVLFQKKGSDKMIPLTEKYIKIDRISFLNDIYMSTKRQYLIYKIKDIDTNNDGELNYEDLQTLYISRIDGSYFMKITKDYHKLIDWKILKSVNRLYFKTIEDKNGDGQFSKKDLLHYFYLDFDTDDLYIKEYYPVNIN